MIKKRGKLRARWLIVLGSAGGIDRATWRAACGAATPAPLARAAGGLPLPVRASCSSSRRPSRRWRRSSTRSSEPMDGSASCSPARRAAGALRRDAGAAARCGARFAARRTAFPTCGCPATRAPRRCARFYARAPFPGYPPRDSLLGAARARRAERVRAAARRAIPGDARIVEIGCGTGQMSLYLARADRVVVGADLTRAVAARWRATRPRASASTACSSSRPICGARACSAAPSTSSLVGRPAPHARSRAPSFAAVAQLARPGGVVVLGVYNALRARSRSRCAAAVARLIGLRCVPFDPGAPRSRATSRRAARRGCAISISTPRSTATRSPRCRAGSPRTASSSCGRFPACSARASGRRSRATSSRRRGRLGPRGGADPGPLNPLLAAEGGVFSRLGQRETQTSLSLGFAFHAGRARPRPANGQSTLSTPRAAPPLTPSAGSVRDKIPTVARAVPAIPRHLRRSRAAFVSSSAPCSSASARPPRSPVAVR